MSLTKEQEEALHLHNLGTTNSIPIPLPIPQLSINHTNPSLPARTELKEDSRPPLKWDVNLAAEAEAYAIILAGRDTGLKHASQQRHGENLYLAAGYGARNHSFATAARMWIDERRGYRGERVGEDGRGGRAVGHYTQVCLLLLVSCLEGVGFWGEVELGTEIDDKNRSSGRQLHT